MNKLRRISLEMIHYVSISILCVVPYFFLAGQAFAQSLGDRSVIISNATPSEVSSELYNLTLTSTASLGSIEFEYCINSPLFTMPCIAPSGLSLSGAALTNQTGNLGFAIDTADSTANSIVISRVASPGLTIPSTYNFANVVNPSVNNQTTYIRISTYSANDASGSIIESGAVAFSTESNFSVGAYVPPYLTLCVAVTVSINCNQSTGNNIDLGTLSPFTTGAATSQFSASTNDFTGYGLYVMGTTITSGNNIITSASSPTPSKIGTSLFGMNLRKNSSPALGSDPDGSGTATVTSDYDSSNLFKFSSGDEIAASSTSTAFTRMTASYAVDVTSSQPPGVYSTTLTYLAAGQY